MDEKLERLFQWMATERKDLFVTFAEVREELGIASDGELYHMLKKLEYYPGLSYPVIESIHWGGMERQEPYFQIHVSASRAWSVYQKRGKVPECPDCHIPLEIVLRCPQCGRTVREG